MVILKLIDIKSSIIKCMFIIILVKKNDFKEMGVICKYVCFLFLL